jgi:glutamate/tyrosine decarboxylase-like PLP-dependent enzyme
VLHSLDGVQFAMQSMSQGLAVICAKHSGLHDAPDNHTITQLVHVSCQAHALCPAGGVNGGSQVCGAMTSGGTESILSAVKASRDYMCARRGITEPEMVIAESAHAAFFKAAEYFRIRLVKVAHCISA